MKTFEMPIAFEGIHNDVIPKYVTWHIGHFEFKAFETLWVQEGHAGFPFYSWKQDMEFPCARCPPGLGGKRHSFLPGWEGKTERLLYKQTLLK